MCIERWCIGLLSPSPFIATIALAKHTFYYYWADLLGPVEAFLASLWLITQWRIFKNAIARWKSVNKLFQVRRILVWKYGRIDLFHRYHFKKVYVIRTSNGSLVWYCAGECRYFNVISKSTWKTAFHFLQ